MDNLISKLLDFLNYSYKKLQEVFYPCLLFLICILFLFLNLGSYPLIDVDETRYIQISKEMFNSGNYITPFLNFEPFLEKPPLFFWANCASFGIFDNYSILTARFANSMFAMFSVFFVYFLAKKMLNKDFALISSLILLSSCWFLIFAHIAILDMAFMAMTTASIGSALYVFYIKKENQKFALWSFWAFIGLATLAKGLIGIIIPICTVLLIFAIKHKLKLFFAPKNFIVGLIIFLLIALPWHVLAYLENGQTWLNEYFLKHHFARFANSGMGLNRKQPFLFYVPIILLGIFPWTLQAIAAIGKIIKTIYSRFKESKIFELVIRTDTYQEKILLFASIWAGFIFLLFSIASTKLPTYILPLVPPMALLCGSLWFQYILGNKYSKLIRLTSIWLFGFILIFGIIALILPFVKIEALLIYLSNMNFYIPSAVILIALSIFAIIFALKNRRILLFSCYIILSFSAITISTREVFEYMVSFGQDELMEYANIAKEDKSSSLMTYDFPRKYSIIEIYGKKVNTIESNENKKLRKEVRLEKRKRKNVYVILRNKNTKNYKRFPKHKVIKKGEKYTLIKF